MPVSPSPKRLILIVDDDQLLAAEETLNGLHAAFNQRLKK